MWILPLLLLILCNPIYGNEKELDDTSRKVLGSSVVTSVSVIMDQGNGTKASFSDAVGRPVLKPQISKLASPIELLNPDRYEFYTFDESGDLVKRLMTIDEIKAIIATSGDDVFNIDNLADIMPEKRVNDIVTNVQNVLKEEMESHKMPDTNQLFDTPDVSDSWSMILPAIFGNSGEEIKAEKTPTASTPETIVLGPTEAATTTKRVAVYSPTTTSTTINPISRFTDYFVETIRTESPIDEPYSTENKLTLIASSKSPSSTRAPSTTQVSSTNKLVVINPTQSAQNFKKPNTESNSLKVQIFPNSNTNLKEDSYSKKPTGSTSDYVRISTPKPEISLESRVSSTVLEHTSELNNWGISEGTTPKSFPSLVMNEASTPKSYPSKIMSEGTTFNSRTRTPQPDLIRTSTPKSGISTRSTPEYTQTRTPKPGSTVNNIEKTTSTTSARPTSLKHEVTTRNSETIVDVNELEKVTKPSTKPTEKIYILLRPLGSSPPKTRRPTSQTTKKFEQSTVSPSPTNKVALHSKTSPSVQTIFTTISQRPIVVSVTPQYRTKPTTTERLNIRSSSTSPDGKTEDPTKLDSTKFVQHNLNSTLAQQLLHYYTTFVSTSSTTEAPSSTSLSQAFTEYIKQASLPTLADILNKHSTTQEVTHKGSEKLNQTTDNHVTTSLPSSISELQNYGSIIGNKYTSSSIKTEAPTIYTTESETEYFKTDSIDTDETEIEKTQTTPMDVDKISNKNFLEKLLLSSTNVYDINSAINQKLTYPMETTSIPDELTTKTNNQVENLTEVSNQTLIESFGQLLAQAVGNIGEVVVPENITEFNLYTDRMSTSPQDSKIEEEQLTSLLPEFTVKDLETTLTTLNREITEDERQTTLSQESDTTKATPLLNKFNSAEEPHLINITIIRKHNNTKPAKADLSLEVDYDLHNLNNTELHNSTTGSSTVNDGVTLDEKTESDIENIPTTDDFFKKFETTVEDIYYTSTLSEETSEPNLEYTTAYTQKSSVSTPPTTIPATNSTTSSLPLTSIANKTENNWTLVSTISPHSKLPTTEKKPTLAPILEPTPTVDLDVKPMQGFGLEESTEKLDADIYQFVQLCNELAFGFWKTVTTGISTARSVVVSPFAATSLLAMVFLGARGSTSGEMNEILKLDNMVTFNPHLIFKTVTESILTGPEFGVATSSIIRQLYSDKSRESILNFYKERARFFYDGHVEEVSFKDVGDTIRRRTNLLVRKQTNGKVPEFLKDGSVRVRSPLAAVSASIMQTDCTKGSISERDGEIHFVVFPSIKQRRLIPIPAVVYRKGFLAGYEPSLDATAVALGDKDDILSFIFVLPGRQGINAVGDGLARLEKRLVESSFQKGAWGRLLRTLIPRPGLEVQIPRFSHRSIINATSALKQMGLRTLFDIKKADLRGLNGVAHDLYLSDMLQFNYFSVCGNFNSPDTHHSEYYPATARRSLRKHRRLDHFEQQKILHDDPLYIIDYLSLPLNLRPRQARVPQVPRLRLDRPFLYFVRHNPTGLILHMGRFNPRLLP